MGKGDGLRSVFVVQCEGCKQPVGVVRLKGEELMLVDEDLGPHWKTCPAAEGLERRGSEWPERDGRSGGVTV